MSNIWDDDDDDDDILELADRPPMTQLAVSSATQVSDSVDVIRAKGEASVLREKLNMLEKNIRDQDENQRKIQKTLEIDHQNEVQKLKIELQRLEDERKFFILEQKNIFNSKQGKKETPDNREVITITTKKRKINQEVKEYVSLVPNHKVQDDCSLFYDYLVSYGLPAINSTVLEMLDHICLNVTDLKLGDDSIFLERRKPIGPFLRTQLFKWKSIYTLDQLVDKTLESFAILIQKISSANETRYPVPFLIALMHATVNFRHSASRINSLKDVFQFLTDLVISDPRVLRKPIHEDPLEIDAYPDVLQYKLLDELTIMYSFDVLESCISILLNCSKDDQLLFVMEQSLLDNLAKCCSLTFSISYRPNLPVILSMTEILLGIVQFEAVAGDWDHWSITASKLVQTWCRDYGDSAKDLDLANLNTCSGYDPCLPKRLIDFDGVRYLPMIIENLPADSSPDIGDRIDFYALKVQINITKIMQKLFPRFQSRLLTSGFLEKSVEIFCIHHELSLTVFLGLFHVNDVIRQQLLTNLLQLIYHTWVSINDDYKKTMKLDSLTICLWRIVFGSTSSPEELDGWSSLINPMKGLSFEEEDNLMDDAFDGEALPSYLKSEQEKAKKEAFLSKYNINASWIFKDVAKYILESITTMDEADSLYVAMVNDS